MPKKETVRKWLADFKWLRIARTYTSRKLYQQKRKIMHLNNPLITHKVFLYDVDGIIP